MKLVFEAIRSARAQPVNSSVIALIVAGVCVAILSTTGQSVRAEQLVLSRIDDAGTRSILIIDAGGSAGLAADAVTRIGALESVEWVIGLSPVEDVRAVGNPGGMPTPIRAVHGALPPPVAIPDGMISQTDVLVGYEAEATLGLMAPLGGVASETADYAVIGRFRADAPLEFLNQGLIRLPRLGEESLRSVYILVDRPAMVGPVTQAALSLVSAHDRSSLRVETSETLADIRAAVAGELGRFGRGLVLWVLLAGLFLSALSTYGSVASRRRDYGRRRALGASRSAIVGLVCLQTTVASALGAIVGLAVSVGVWAWAAGEPPDAGFSIAIALLAVLTSAFASIPPSIVAAFRDPVTALRVP